MNIISAFDTSTMVESDYNDKISMNKTYVSQQEKVALSHANDYGDISTKCCESSVCSFSWNMRYDEKTEKLITGLVYDNLTNHDRPVEPLESNNEYRANPKSKK